MCFRKYFKGPQFSEKASAKGKVAIVTGASSGIGKMLVRELNLRGAKVYLFCRNEEKARNAVKDLFAMVCLRRSSIATALKDTF